MNIIDFLSSIFNESGKNLLGGEWGNLCRRDWWNSYFEKSSAVALIESLHHAFIPALGESDSFMFGIVMVDHCMQTAILDIAMCTFPALVDSQATKGYQIFIFKLGKFICT